MKPKVLRSQLEILRSKKAFSYKTDVFLPALLVSLAVHGSFLGTAAMSPAAPQFAVRNAPHSMEVVLAEEHPVPASVKNARREPLVAEEGEIAPSKTVLESEGSADPIPAPRRDSAESTASSTAMTDGLPVKKDNQPQGARTLTRPLYHQNPSPPYPQIARRKEWEGTVFLRVLVDKTGLVRDIAVEKSSGHRLLDKTAMETVMKWRFLPARSNRVPFASWVTIPVQFKLVSEIKATAGSAEHSAQQ